MSSRTKRDGFNVSQISGRPNNCPKCGGRSEKRPCEDWVDELRKEFSNQINELFRKKMQEFIEFIEETVNVDD